MTVGRTRSGAWLRASCRVASVAMLVWLVSGPPARTSACENGLYLAPDWIQTDKPDSEIEAFVQKLASMGMTQLFIPANGFKPEHRDRLRRFQAKARGVDPRVRIYAMLGRRVCGASKERCFDAGDASKQLQIETTAKELWSAGFDGIQLDFEPVPDGDDDLVRILRRLRNSRPAGRTLSLAGYFLKREGPDAPNVTPHPRSTAPLLQWSVSYYQGLLESVDQVMVMLYDTALTDPEEYRVFVAWQTRHFLDLATQRGVAIQIGLPAAVSGRTGLYDRKAENLGTGIKGVAAALKDTGGACPIGSGITVFAESGLSPELVTVFDETWVHRSLKPGR